MEEGDGLVCPLCITPLDVMESGWVPCPCGYQLCLFCYERIRNEFNNQCPGCRTPYDPSYQGKVRASPGPAPQPRPQPTPARRPGNRASQTAAAPRVLSLPAAQQRMPSPRIPPAQAAAAPAQQQQQRQAQAQQAQQRAPAEPPAQHRQAHAQQAQQRVVEEPQAPALLAAPSTHEPSPCPPPLPTAPGTLHTVHFRATTVPGEDPIAGACQVTVPLATPSPSAGALLASLRASLAGGRCSLEHAVDTLGACLHALEAELAAARGGAGRGRDGEAHVSRPASPAAAAAGAGGAGSRGLTDARAAASLALNTWLGAEEAGQRPGSRAGGPPARPPGFEGFPGFAQPAGGQQQDSLSIWR
ncbi:hypothetical protein ACKKBF_B39055 [Auxenochlorella protothecoides x Auxenochlorella symbiontica]